VAIATGVLFGLAPAFHATANGPATALGDDSRVSTSHSRLLPSLVSAQVALSLVLLVGAALFVRTLQNLRSFDPGFQPDRVLLVELEGRRTSIAQEVLYEIRQVPGVISASASTHTPLNGWMWSEAAVPAGQTVPDRDTAVFVGAGPQFFATMQIPLLAGREFTERDSRNARGVAVVNERYAEHYFAGQNPLGQHLAATVRGESRNLEVVGLVRNTSTAGLREAPPATVYVAYAQLTGDFPTSLEIRVAGPLEQVAAAMREVLRRKLPNSLIEVRPLSAQVDDTMVRERMMATLAAAFGLLALMLAAIGLYGLLAYSVERRTKEIGIRMALGAERIPVVALILQGAARLVIIGIAIGLPAAWAAARGIETMLFGVTPMDPAAVAGAIVALTITAQLAAYLPAWRASRVDPLTALRHE
jgi:predicted permease